MFQDGRHYEEKIARQDGLIFLIVDGFGCLNMQIDSVGSEDVIVFLF